MIAECPGCKSRHDVSGRPAGTRARCRCGTVFALPDPPASAGGLTCPNCRGAVETGSHRCQFCGVGLLVCACPRCFARIFHGHSHCPHCGAGASVPAQADPDGSTHARQCPVCPGREALLARLVGDVLLDECPSCHGVWLDSAAVERVVRERRESSMATLRQISPPGGASPAGPEAAAPPGRRMYIPCPDCAQMMNRVNFARRSGVILDVCRAHGTWFDATELRRVVEFILEGGIEESQRREIEELRQEARRAAAEIEGQRVHDFWSAVPQPRSEPAIGLELFSLLLGKIGRILY